jgi:hypothetical protein
MDDADLMLKGSIDQIEKFSNINVPLTTTAGKQSIALQVPQLVSWRLNERFRWPADQVLLVSCGVRRCPDAMSSTAPRPLRPVARRIARYNAKAR